MTEKSKYFVFKHPELGELNVILKENGEVFFSLPDVCRMLGISEEDGLKKVGLENIHFTQIN
jgi:prophage antirepressor-like protein